MLGDNNMVLVVVKTKIKLKLSLLLRSARRNSSIEPFDC